MLKERPTSMTAQPDLLEAALDGRAYQRAAAEFIAEHGNVLIADQPGLGKTIEVLAGLRYSHNPGAKFLILCPRVAVRDVWASEIAERIDPERVEVVMLRGTGVKRRILLADALTNQTKTLFVIGNIEMARIKPEKINSRVKWLPANALYPLLFTAAWDAVVVDESQRALVCVNRKQAKWSQQYAGMRALVKVSKQRIAVSGTPMRSKPEQLWGTLNWLRPRHYPGYWSWVERYFETGGNHFTEYDSIVGKLRRPNALSRDLQDVMLRRTKQEVLPELPPILYAGHHLIPRDKQSPFGVWLEMDDKQARQYRMMVDEGVVVTDNGEMISNGTLAQNSRKMLLANGCAQIDERGRLVPMLPSPKFDWLLGKIDELDGERLVVASKSTLLLNLWAAELSKLGVAHHLLTGQVTSDRKRDAMRADFQSADPSASVFMLNTYAGGVALTLDMADYGVGVDETYNTDDREQVENRLHRTSRIHQVTWWQLNMLDTIEEEISWLNAARADTQRLLMDGTRGVAWARNLYLEKRSALSKT